MTAQLALRIGLRDVATFDNFESGGNGAAVHALRSAAEPFIYLWGAPGTGRTHLLQAACHAAAAQGETPAYLPCAEIDSPEVLEGLEALTLVCLDDLHRVAGREAWESALFGFYNAARAVGTRLVVSADAGPQGLALRLPDLFSRLTWGPVFRLNPLSDEEKISALQRRAAARGLELTSEVGAFLLRRAPRDTHALFSLLDRLDDASLVAQRRLTIPFVREQLHEG